MISQKELNPASVQKDFWGSEPTGHKNSQSDEIFGHRITYRMGSINAYFEEETGKTLKK